MDIKENRIFRKVKKILSIDICFHTTKKERVDREKIPFNERNKLRNEALYATLKQNEYGFPELFMEKDTDEPPSVAVSDSYIENVKKGLIKLVRSEVFSISGKMVSFKNGETFEADEIILGLGYSVDCSFLDSKLQELLKYDPKSKRWPLELEGNYVFNRKIKNLAFVGLSPFDAIAISWEFQAMIALNYFKYGKDFDEYLKKFRVFSKEEIDYKDLLEFNEKVAEEAGYLPDYDFIEKEDKELFDILMKAPFCARQYFLKKENYKTSVWEESVQICKKYYQELKRSFLI